VGGQDELRACHSPRLAILAALVVLVTIVARLAGWEDGSDWPYVVLVAVLLGVLWGLLTRVRDRASSDDPGASR
jgi:hypothetical protein